MIDWDDVDAKLTDPTFFAGPHFHELFTLLRKEDPVHLTKGNYARPYWSVTKYEDCLRLLEEPELFSSSAGTHLPPEGRDLTEEERYKMGYDVQLVVSDPPVHAERRRPFNKHFSIPAVAKLRGECERIVDKIIADIAPRGEADLVADIAALLPVNLFLSMMGIPREDWDKVRSITIRMLHAQDPEFLGDENPTDVTVNAFDALYQYIYQHTMSRRGKPTDDFASLIANMEYKGKLIDEREAAWMAFSVVAGGLETTRNAAAIGFMELMARPDQAKLIREGGDDVAKSAVEEIIRWVTPSKNRLRVAMDDVELGGKKIKKGDWVVGWIVSANRDEDVFENPQEFNILRSPNKHLGFGDGEHICLGRNVARLELRILLQKVLRAFPDLEPAGEAEWVASDNTTGLKRLPVKFTPRDPQTVAA